MLRTILSRLGRALSVGFWVMVISFSIMRIIPGDPAAARLGGVEQDAIEVLRKELNLDGSIMQQFSTYIVGLLKGDLGVSLQTGRSVTDIIGSTLPLTVYLIIFSTFFAFVLSIPLGTAIAWSGRASIVYSFRVITSIILAIPNFFIAMIGILIFTVRVNWSPVFGYEPQFPQNLKYLWLPVLVNTIIMISVISRVLFSSVVETKE